MKGMIEFTTIMLQFAEQGEKTGWTYIEIPADIAQQLKPGTRTSYRVRGMLDAVPVRFAVIVPAEKLPEASRFTIVFAVFALVAAFAALEPEATFAAVTPPTCSGFPD